MKKARVGVQNSTVRIAQAIWQNPLASRSDIADTLGLDRSTVSLLVGKFIESGLVCEVSEGAVGPNGGRKPIHLVVNRDYGAIIGVEVQAGGWSMAVVNLAGDILFFEKQARMFESASFVKDLAALIESCIEEHCAGMCVLGAGVGISGLVDSDHGIIMSSIPLAIDGPLAFCREIAPLVSCPVFIENDANCCAWGELAFHRADGLRHFLFVLGQFRNDEASLREYGGLGVGFGIVLNGAVYAGGNCAAGEFRSVFHRGSGPGQFSIDPAGMWEMEGRPELVGQLAAELAQNVAMLANTFVFERVFVGGDIERASLDVIGLFESALRANWVYPGEPFTSVRPASLGNRAVAFGAAGLLMHRFFSSEQLLASRV